MPINGSRYPVSRKKPSKRLLTASSMAVVLLAALVLALRSDPGEPSDDQPAKDQSRSRAGVRDVAKEYSELLGSRRMFESRQRAKIVKTVVAEADHRDVLARMTRSYDHLNTKLGLDDGETPDGSSLVNSTSAVETRTISYTQSAATIDVWCVGLFGLAGEKAPPPAVTEDWFTMTLHMKWTTSGWRITEFTQEDGPTPTEADRFLTGR